MTQTVHNVSQEGHSLNRENCLRCGKCIDACPISDRRHMRGALTLLTKKIEISDLWNMLYPQLDLLRSIGGITISGGDALLQIDGLKQLLLLCKKSGIHTAVETSGSLPVQYFEAIIELVDCWLFGQRPTSFYRPPNDRLIDISLTFLAKNKTMSLSECQLLWV